MSVKLINTNFPVNKLKSVNTFHKQITFSGRKNDDIFQRSVTFTEEEYNKKLQENPNTAFLYDPKLTQAEKEEIIKKTPTLKTTAEITKELGRISYEWLDDSFFVSEKYTPQKEGKYKLPIKIYDMTLPINKENFEKLNKAKSNLRSSLQFASDNELSLSVLHRHLKDGYIKHFTLRDKETLEQKNTSFIDKTDKSNEAGIERARKLSPTRSKHEKGARGNKPYLVNVLELSKLGYGTPTELAKLVKEKRIEGEIKKVTTPDGEQKILAKIDLSVPNTKEDLFRFKIRNCDTIGELAEKTGIPRLRIEEAILDGTLTAITEKLLFNEANELYINMTDLKNVDVITQMTFEQKVLEDIIQAKKNEESEAKREESSLQMKITWHLCPKTQRIAKSIVAQDENLQLLFQDKRDIEDEIAEAEEKGINTNFLHFELENLTSDENEELRSFYKRMWSRAGTEEFTNAMKKAKEIMEIYKTQGIDAIDDEEIKMIILGL